MLKSKMIKKIVATIILLAMLLTIVFGTLSVKAIGETESLNALKVEIQWEDNITATEASTILARFGLDKTQAWPLNTIYAGEKFSYEVYIPSDGNYAYGMGGFDGQSPDLPGYWVPSSIVDQYNLPNYAQLDALGTDKWIQRDFTFSTQATFWHLGISVVSTGYDMTSFAGKTSTIYYRNIKISDRVIYDGTSAISSYLVENAGSYAGIIKSITITDGNYTFKKETTASSSSEESSIVSSESSSEVSSIPHVPEVIGKALEYKIAFNADLSGAPATLTDFRSINGYGAFASIKVNTGDKLVYDVYIPSNGNYIYGMGAIDGQYNVNWGFIRASNPQDTNGKYLYTNLATDYGTDKWITRELSLTAANEGLGHVGPGSIITKTDALTLQGLTAKVYYRNIKIVHANNSVENIYVDGGFNTNDKMETSIDGTLGTVSLAEVTIGSTSSSDSSSEESSIASSESSSSSSSTPGVVVAPAGKSLMYKINWKSSLPTPADPMFDWRNINGAGAFLDVKLLPGDTFTYDVYIPSNGNYIGGVGGMDLQAAESWHVFRFFDGTPYDSDDNELFCDLEDTYGADRWITREFTISSRMGDGNGLQHIGPAALIGSDFYEQFNELAGKSTTVYYRNIKIKHTDGTTSVIFDDNTNLLSSDVIETHLQNYATIEFTKINNTPSSVSSKTVSNNTSEVENSDTSDNINYIFILAFIMLSSSVVIFVSSKKVRSN